jgi:hypothetical protein
MKKGKVKSSVQKEGDIALKKIDSYKKLYEVKKKISDLEGKSFEGIGKLPGYPEPPAMEEETKKSVGDIAKGILGGKGD